MIRLTQYQKFESRNFLDQLDNRTKIFADKFLSLKEYIRYLTKVLHKYFPGPVFSTLGNSWVWV